MNNFDEEAFVREMQHKEIIRKAQKFHEELLAIDPFYRERMMKIKKINKAKDDNND